MSSVIVALTFFACCLHVCAGKFHVPTAKFEALSPKGFRVSIPDVEGITLFGFHGSPFPIDNPQVGHWPRDVTKPTDGRWTYTNRDTELKAGDKIYYWTYIIYDGVGYREHGGLWTYKGEKPTEGLFGQMTDNPSTRGFDVSTTVRPQPSRTKLPVEESTIENKSKSSEHQSLIATTPTISTSVEPTVSPRSRENLECEKTLSEVPNIRKICSGDLMFESDFSTLSTLMEKFSPEVMFPNAPDFPFVVYMNGSHISVDDDRLSIKTMLLEDKFKKGITREKLTLEGCTGVFATEQCEKSAQGAQILPPVVSGKLTTKNTFNFKYGRVEVRAKLPQGNWIVPEMLLEPRDQRYGSDNYASGMMKIAAAKGNAEYSKQLVGGVIMSDKLPFRKFGLKFLDAQDSWSRDFHNYTLVWKPDRISLYVDGENYGNVQETESFSEIGKRNKVEAANKWANGNKIAPFDQMFYISLGLQAGGVKIFSDDTAKAKPWLNKSKRALVDFWKSRDEWLPTWSNAELQVDYVRVYAL